MKNYLLLLFAVSIFTGTHAQFNEGEMSVSIGLNSLVDDEKGRNPFTNQIHNAIPIALALNYNLSTDFALEQSVSFNRFSNDIKDSGPLDKKYYYFSTDSNLKYNFGQHIFGASNRPRIELYAMTGFGFYYIENFNITGNLGAGLLFWTSDNQNIGLRVQTLGKFGKKDSNEFLRGSYYQHSLQLVFVL